MRVLQRVHSLCPRAQVDLAAKWPRRPAPAVDDRSLLLYVRAAVAGSLAVGVVEKCVPLLREDLQEMGRWIEGR